VTTISKTNKNDEVILFEKSLTKSERREHVIRVPFAYRHLFPEQGGFTVLIANREVEMKIDRSSRVNPGKILWSEFKELLDFDEARDRLVFAKTAGGRIILRKR